MTITTEQVKRLCAASGVDEIAALSALERQDGDLLEALLELERQGWAVPPAGGGFYSTRQAEPEAGGPLVPGGGIYSTMEHALNGESSLFLSTGAHTLGVAGALAVGILMVSSLVRMYSALRRRRRSNL